jgi:hypothetical protein
MERQSFCLVSKKKLASVVFNRLQAVMRCHLFVLTCGFVFLLGGSLPRLVWILVWVLGVV